ncbi:hypothetical protein VPH35_028177 [Triticum aestivum]
MELDDYYETIYKRDIFMFLFGLAAGFMFGVAFMLDNPSTDYYSVKLTGITASSPTSPPAFNFTLRVENKGLVYEKLLQPRASGRVVRRRCHRRRPHKGPCRAVVQTRTARVAAAFGLQVFH